MNDTCGMWSLPWHALQRNLALGLGGDAPAHAGAIIKVVNVQSAGESMALTQVAWSRARARLAELEALRDALGEELEALDEREGPFPAGDSNAVRSAA